MEETENFTPEKVLAQYKEVAEKHKTWEKGHFYLAVYYEKLMNNVGEKSKDKCNRHKKYEFVLPLLFIHSILQIFYQLILE